jgi:site-specific recombinase XerD
MGNRTVTDAQASAADNWAAQWEEWLFGWELALKVTARPQTVTTYRRGAAQFIAWLEQNVPDVNSPGRVTSRHVEAWLASLTDSGRGPATRRVRLMTLRALFAWIVAEPGSPVPTNPAAGVRAPEVLLGPVPVVTDEALTKLLATCRGGTFADVRDTAMIRLLLACGVRRGELVGITLDDVDLTHGDVLVHGKGGKDRVISLPGSRTTLALSRYLRLRRQHPFAASTDRVFLPVRTAGRPGPLEGGGVAEMLRRRSAQAGIPTIHPHLFRHSWADAAKRAGLSDEDLERIAGWTSPLMVRRYGRALAEERARDAHRRLGTGDRV